jgi:hypothetical protein
MGIVMARYGVSRKHEKRYSVFFIVLHRTPGYVRHEKPGPLSKPTRA